MVEIVVKFWFGLWCWFGVFVDYLVVGLKEVCIVEVVCCGLGGFDILVVGYFYVDIW